MTIQDIRRERLAKLIEDKYESQAAFITATSESQSEVSGLLREKSFGEKKARKIEVKCGLPIGWLDSLDMELPPSSAGSEKVGGDLDDAAALLAIFAKLSPVKRSFILDMATGMATGTISTPDAQGSASDNQSQ